MIAARASAPGKIILAGEYAVLRGDEAVVMAVDRRVVATLADAPQPLSPFLAAVREVLAERGEAAAAARVTRIAADSSALREAGGIKLGLGSSAAVTVAATALALSSAAPAIVGPVAGEAHGRAQQAMGARGSGADVAAAVHGGVIGFRLSDRVRPLSLPAGLVLRFLWCGAAADTRALVARVQAHGRTAPAAHGRLLDAIAAAARALTDARDAMAAITALRAGGEAVAALGNAVGMDLETSLVRRARAIAEAHGGAAKSTGAGGGDIAVVAVPAPAAAALDGALAGADVTPLALAIDPRGAEVAPAG